MQLGIFTMCTSQHPAFRLDVCADEPIAFWPCKTASAWSRQNCKKYTL